MTGSGRVRSHDLTRDFGGFSDVTPLDGGGFGTVYRAVRASTGGLVAIKVLDRAQVDSVDVLTRRIEREIAALIALKGHPNVVQVEEVIATDRGPAIVMEYMDAGTVLMGGDSEAMSPGQVAYVGASVAAGLVAAHRAGIVHRDVKPQNILRNSFGQIKLCDFGISAITRSDGFHTRTTSLSVQYASPEELDNRDDVAAPTDVYSLGASLHHLFHGSPPSFSTRRGDDVDRTIPRGALRTTSPVSARVASSG